MAIWELSKPRCKLEQCYCPIRKAWVAAIPEEKIRQKLLAHMLGQYGYPLAHLSIEKSLQQLPHVGSAAPNRRIDLICFAKDLHPEYELFPLLLIECKAIPLTAKVMAQIIGYNHYVKAPYIAIANDQEVRTGWYNPQSKEYQFVSFLPHYNQLFK